MTDQNQAPTSFGGALFTTTHWSIVLKAGGSQEALEKLCQDYWRPLYAFIRRQGYDVHAAKDLTQGFFASLLERNDFAFVDRERGKFRTFLLVSLKHFLCNQLDLAATQKRGGGVPHLPLEALGSAECPGTPPADDLTPDQVFDRQWALSLLETVLARLEAEFSAAGKQRLFSTLQHLLTGERSEATYAELATPLQLTESAVKVVVHRMRLRYRELLHEEVARTVSTAGQVEEELRNLVAALRR